MKSGRVVALVNAQFRSELSAARPDWAYQLLGTVQ
jgi:hypothetical protein